MMSRRFNGIAGGSLILNAFANLLTEMQLGAVE